MKRFFLALYIILTVISITYADDTPRLALPEMTPHISQPDIIYNEAIYKIDALVFPMLSAYPASASPDLNSATEGNLFIVPSAATGDWLNHDDDLAVYQNSAWAFIAPVTGCRVYKPLTGLADLFKYRQLVFGGNTWLDINRKQYENIYIGNYDDGSGAGYYATLGLNWDESLPFSSFGPVHIKIASSSVDLLYIDPVAKYLTSDWPIRSASGFVIGSATGYTGVIPNGSGTVVSGGIITGVTD